MYSVKAESSSNLAGELLTLPQVVYERQTGRFYRKLQSWWNRPTRLQQAAEELVYEDLLHGKIDLEVEENLWEWLEHTARRTSVLHQMSRRIEISTSASSFSVEHMAGFDKALSAKLASEYFATFVKVLLHISLQEETDSKSNIGSPFKDQFEEDHAIEQILLVSTYQLCLNLKSAQSGIDQDLSHQREQENTPDVRRALALTNDIEQALYALLNGFGKARLKELEEDADTDSESEPYDETVESAVEKLYTDGIVHRSSTPPDTRDRYGQAKIDHEEESTWPSSTLLHEIIGQIETDILDVSRQEDRISGKARMMLEVAESLREGLRSLHANADTDSDSKASRNIAQTFASNDTPDVTMENTAVWATFSACLIKTSLLVALYGRQERVKGGKSFRRDQCGRAEQGRDRASPDLGVIHQGSSARDDTIISMTEVEQTYVQLMDAAVICASVTCDRSCIHDLLILIAGLWDRYVEYQTACWMSLPGPIMQIIDFIDHTEVAIGLRRLFKEVLLRNDMTADDLASAGLERSLIYRWETMLALAA